MLVVGSGLKVSILYTLDASIVASYEIIEVEDGSAIGRCLGLISGGG